MGKLYRFVTTHRVGKWYPDLGVAKAQAYRIGAGFMAQRTGEFCAYLGTRLEVLLPDGQIQPFQAAV